MEGTGRIPKTAPAARTRGSNRLRRNEVQVLIIWNLIQVISILQQLPAHVLVHLLCRGIPGGVSGFQLPITVRVKGHQVFIWTLAKSSIAPVKLH